MFIGEYTHTIDQKRRVSIPAKFRKALGERAVITRGLDNCLVLYPLEEWERVATKLEELPSGQVNARSFTRIMLSGATDVELDALGRILLPDHLVQYAFLKKNVAIIGLSNRIEIWDQVRWTEYKSAMEKTVGEIAQQLGI
jgi:MraZ protein